MAKFDAALITHPGFEDIAAAEVKELIGVKAATTAAGIIAFELKQPTDLCRLCYLSQSASSVLFSGKSMSPFDLGTREHAVFGKSGDLPGNIAYMLLRAAGYDGKKSLFDPFTRSGSIAIEAALFSSGFPVNYYRKEALALALSRLKQFSGISFNNFFAVAEKGAAAAAAKRAKSGRLKILSSSQSMQNVRFAEKNAKIAGVNKLIRFSRLDIEWLDAKLDEHSIDLVVSYPPQLKSDNNNFAATENEKLKKMYKNFFYQADFFLGKKGAIALLLKAGLGEVTKAAEAYRFKPEILRKFKIGNEAFELVSFSR